MKRIASPLIILWSLIFVLTFSQNSLAKVETHYFYDGLNRLQAAYRNSNLTSYTYDSIGNILAQKSLGAPISFSITGGGGALTIGTTFQLNVTGYFPGALALDFGEILTWGSSNTCVATVAQDGKVTVKGLGTSLITATDSNGATATFFLDIHGTPIVLTGVNIAIPAVTTPPGPETKADATSTITSKQVFSCGSRGEYSAGTSIILSPGFQAQANSTFRAYIKP